MVETPVIDHHARPIREPRPAPRDLGAEVMLARQRQALILERVRDTGAVRVAEIARDLGVSDMTVRRDLEVLHERGLLEKVHGGATAISGLALFEPGFIAKSELQQAEKAAIGAAAAALVEPGMAIAISAGTTTHALASRVADIPGVTVVTNAIGVAETLHRAGRRDQTVILTGGTRTPSEALVGPFTVAHLRSIHVDLAFMGVHGIDAKAGFTCPNLLEAETDVALIEAARQLIVVADHTKWGVVGIASIARLDEADILVSDVGLAGDARSVLCEKVGRVILADPDGGGTLELGGVPAAPVRAAPPEGVTRAH
jgi:DeoR/GlpR family transcriptional regulator of sugar metabolism